MTNQLMKIEEGYQYILQDDYQKAAIYFEQAIETEPGIKIYYWYLGLCLILKGEEEQATLTWFLGMSETDDEAEIEIWTLELSQVLQKEAERQEQLDNKKLSWTIRQHLRSINPTDVNNLLSSFDLAIQLKILDDAYWYELNIIETLESVSDYNYIDSNLVLKITKNILELTPLARYILDFMRIFTKIIKHQNQNIREFRYIVVAGVINISKVLQRNYHAAQILEILLEISPENQDIL
ncbi:MAG: O-linked N-acetylglucosamine transferase, SPINDLY family protein, partial [Sphaerospermopsis sp. SIO1G2]|nr:O-linked N-acetylglucosamine transferase, SPINDLY family protein [Sphaerospermopsis sp. SIO1G2]